MIPKVLPVSNSIRDWLLGSGAGAVWGGKRWQGKEGSITNIYAGLGDCFAAKSKGSRI